MVERIERLFPNLRGTAWRVPSPFDRDYNCIAWAAGDTRNWWWPVSLSRPIFWPAGAPSEVTLTAFASAFATLGFAPVGGEQPEPGVEKVALFTDAAGTPTHASRQLLSGIWTSKLGAGEDIEHTLQGIEGEVYGAVAIVLGRPMPLTPTAPVAPAASPPPRTS